MINERQINQFCLHGESNCVDYKRAQYAFLEAEDAKKSELLKDVLCFANAFRSVPAYILVGVDEDASGLGEICGINANDVIDDSRLQEFVNSKTNKPIPFLAYPCKMSSGVVLQVIEIGVCIRDRPFHLKKDYGKLHYRDVWVRAGTSSHIATPEEVAAMGRAAVEFENAPDIKTSLVSENGDAGDLVSVCITCDIKQEDNGIKRKLAYLSGGTEYDRYIWLKTNVAKLHFRLEAENVSRVNAEGLKYQYELKCNDGSVVWSDAPAFGGSSFDFGRVPFSSALNQTKDLRPKEKDTCAADMYLEVVHGGKFSIEVTVYGKNIPEPIKKLFEYSVSVEELPLRVKSVIWLNMALRKPEDVLLCIKWLVSQIKKHVSSVDIDAAVFQCAEKKLQELDD